MSNNTFRLAQGGKGMRVKVLTCAVAAGSGSPSVVLDDRLTIACGHASVRLLTIQREGGAPMDAAAFLRGLPVPAGTSAQ